MNALNREIVAGDRVVVNGRVFVCSGEGFGCHTFTSGQAVFGKWEASGVEARIEGGHIDVAATTRINPVPA